MGKFDKLVFELPTEYNEITPLDSDGEYIVSPQAYFRGGTQIPGSKMNVGFQVIVKPVYLDRVPHYHDEDEYLVFLGIPYPDVFDFDADVAITIGEEGKDAEVYHVTKPCVIRIPAGVVHCPIKFERVDKPIFFQAIMMTDMFQMVYSRPGEDGRLVLHYNGPGNCKMNPDKKCDCCRKCITDDWESPA